MRTSGQRCPRARAAGAADCAANFLRRSARRPQGDRCATNMGFFTGEQEIKFLYIIQSVSNSPILWTGIIPYLVWF